MMISTISAIYHLAGAAYDPRLKNLFDETLAQVPELPAVADRLSIPAVPAM